MFVKIYIYVYLNFNAAVFFSLPLVPKLTRIQQCEIFLDFLMGIFIFGQQVTKVNRIAANICSVCLIICSWEVASRWSAVNLLSQTIFQRNFSHGK